MYSTFLVALYNRPHSRVLNVGNTGPPASQRLPGSDNGPEETLSGAHTSDNLFETDWGLPHIHEGKVPTRDS